MKKKMKKTVGIFSLVVMLLTQVFSPFAYAATGDVVEVEETQVVTETKDETVVTETEAPEVVNEPEKPENSLGDNNTSSGNNNEPQTESGVILTQIQPESQSGASIGEMNTSGDVKVLSGTDENLKEENEVLSGSKEGSGFIETVKNLFGIGESEEKNEDEGFESQEIYGTGEYNGVKVEVYAATGLFESGVYLIIEPVIEDIEQVKEVLLSGDVEIPEEEEEQTVVAFDITFRDPITKEDVQPKNGTVEVKFDYEGNEQLKQAEENEEQEVKIYHLNDISVEGEKIQEINGTKVEEVIINEEKSEEENVMVVDAEKFSVYTIIRTNNISGEVNIIYNLNGGYMKSGNEKIEGEKIITYNKNEKGNYTTNEMFRTPSNDGICRQEGIDKDMKCMFDGWYYSGLTERWIGNVTSEMNNKTVYAKWLPFEDKEVEVSNDIKIIIMDRNLGATQSGTNCGSNNPGPCGYHYQWGNNYGFKPNMGNNSSFPNGESYGNDKIDYENWENHVSTFYNGFFNLDYAWNSGATISDNLRGGSSSNNSDELKQGPCPEGYHVPDIEEWKKLGYLSEKLTTNELFNKLGLPGAGYRNIYAPSVYNLFGEAYYWSSNPSLENNQQAYHVSSNMSLNEFGAGGYRSMGLSVRCFKNSSESTLLKIKYRVEDGIEYRLYKTRWWDQKSVESFKPENPVKEGYEFLGWYESGKNEYYDFTKPLIKNVELYAKWYNENEIEDELTSTIISGNNFNNIIITLANDEVLDSDTKIKNIKRVGEMPDGVNKVLVSTVDSDSPIYVWFNEGDNTIFLYSKSKTIYINEDASGMFSNLTELKKLDILNSLNAQNVKNMDGMFAGLSKLEKIDLSTFRGNDKIETMELTFGGCSSLRTIDLSELNTINVKSMENMFGGCSSLESVDLKGMNLNNVETMAYMFGGCSSLESIDLKGMNLNNVETMANMFAGCSSLESIDMKGMKLNSLKSMENMFGGASNLSKIDMSYFEAPELLNTNSMFGGTSLKTIKMDHMVVPKLPSFYVFGGLTYLQNIDLSYTDIRSVSSLGGLFAGCYNLEKVDMHNLIASGANTISSMFSSDPNLIEVNLNNVDFRNVTDMSSLFSSASSLKKVNFDGMIANNVTNMSYMFQSCQSLETIDVSMLNTSKVTSMPNMFNSCTKLRSVKMDGWDLRKLSSASSAGGFFSNTPSLTSISASGWKLPNNFSNWIYRSWYAQNIEEIDVTNWNLSGTTNIVGLFGGSQYLKRIKGLNTWTGMNSLTNISEMFQSCPSLEEIDVSHLNTSKVTSMTSMFNSCTKLRSVKMDGWDLRKLSSASSAGGFFSNTPSLTSISASGWKLPNDFSNWISRSWYAQNIEEIDVTNWNLSGTTNIVGLFGSSQYLKRIKGLNTWTGMNSLTNISEMFASCIKLTELDLSNWDTSKVTSMSNLCAGCSKLKSINMDGWNFRSISSMYNTNGVLGNTPSLTSISASGWKLPSNFYDWIRYWNALTVEEINVTNWNLSGTENLGGLFAGASKLKTIKGMDSWTETSQIGNTYQMFNGCKSLTDVDLSGIETDNIRITSEMFKGASKLKTIYVSKDFKTGDISDDYGTGMFDLSISLVGGNGTIYNSNKTNQEYAVIDDETHSGYFTNILDKPYTIDYNLNGGTLSGEKTSYTQRISYVLPQPTKAGYVFKGWTGSNGNTPEKNVSTEGKKGNLEYTANWEKEGKSSGGSGGGSSASKKETETKVDEQEHNVAEEKETKEESEQETKEKIENNESETTKGTTNTSVNSEVLSAYEWAYKNKVTTMPTLQEAMPDRTVKRGHLAKMVVNYAVNVLGYTIPEEIPTECKWKDKKKNWESQEIKDYAVQSCALGLMGINTKKFLPNKEVTRAEFGTIMSRLLWGKKYDGGTPYYKNHLNSLKENNIMTQIENPEKRTELRQWVWLMLMRSAENK